MTLTNGETERHRGTGRERRGAVDGLYIDCEWNASPQYTWWKGGVLHRVDGPAHIGPSSSSFEEAVRSGVWYWYDGKRLGRDAEGFWALWEKLTPEERGSLELHRWMSRYFLEMYRGE